jgi:hypothetical protein
MIFVYIHTAAVVVEEYGVAASQSEVLSKRHAVPLTTCSICCIHPGVDNIDALPQAQAVNGGFGAYLSIAGYQRRNHLYVGPKFSNNIQYCACNRYSNAYRCFSQPINYSSVCLL